MAKGFPTKIYVTRELEGDTAFLYATDDLEASGDHGERVGIYELKSIATVSVKRELVPDRPRARKK